MKKIIPFLLIAAFAATACDKSENPYEPKVYTGEISEGKPVSGGAYNVVEFGGGCTYAWCTMNVGATSPEQIGGLYKWGDKYDYNTKAEAKMKVDTATELLGSKYEMPGIKAFNEIISNCTWEYVKYNGQLGYVITGKNGNNIFLPLTNGSIEGKDFVGKYWSKTSQDEASAWMLFFDPSSRNVETAKIAEIMAVRGVLKQ